MKKNLKRIFIISFLAILILMAGYLLTIPSVSYLRYKNPEFTSMMKYRLANSKKGYRIHKRYVSLNEISPYLIKAVLIAEDDRFFMHEGIDIDATIEAIKKDIIKRRFVAGGSTITQQLAKNLFLTPEKTILRKIREAIIAWRLEKALTKKRILELYLNVVEWGHGIFGAEMASLHYFGKPALYLTPEESARLAAILPNPLRYSPFSESGFVQKRTELILEIMKKRNIIPPDYELEKELRNEAQPVD